MTNQTTHIRQSWSSRLTYVLTVAGATIGFGATWRFPYLVGENGGGAYVILFCIAMMSVGIPMILVENVIGRRMQVNAIDAFSGTANGVKIAPYWKIIGYMGLLGAFGILAYYMVLGGWVLSYIFGLLFGNLNLSSPVDTTLTAGFFDQYIKHNPSTVLFYTFCFTCVNAIILIKGIKEGIERSVKFLMPILFIFLLIMIIRNITLPGAMEGIRFYLIPDFSKITAELFIFVLGQVFFALSLGFGVMITLSSYLNKNENLIKTASMTGVINTLIALAAGFMIFPSLFTFNVPPNSGPTLVFQSLPIVFSHMWAGTFFATVFFSLLIVAALTTSITIYEVLVTAIQEKTNFSRKQAILFTLATIFLIGNIPSVLGDNYWQHITIYGRSIFDTFDYVSGNILFILTALGASLFVGYVLKDEAKKELGTNKTLTNVWFFYIKYIIPVIILTIFISSL